MAVELADDVVARVRARVQEPGKQVLAPHGVWNDVKKSENRCIEDVAGARNHDGMERVAHERAQVDETQRAERLECTCEVRDTAGDNQLTNDVDQQRYQHEHVEQVPHVL